MFKENRSLLFDILIIDIYYNASSGWRLRILLQRVENYYKLYEKDLVQDSEWNNILLIQLSDSFTVLQMSVKSSQKFMFYAMFVNGDAISSFSGLSAINLLFWVW